jgi:hypothetical protein
MSVLNDGAAFLKALLGLKVSRATANLPQTTQAAIFTVSGGRVVVTGLVGTVTTAIQNQACTLKVTGNPTAGTDVDIAAASASIAAKEVGGTATLPATLGAQLVVSNAGGAVMPIGSGVVLNPGTLDIVTSASNTGQMKWDITYVPLDDGASITAA